MYQNFARIKYRVKEEPREVVLNYDVNNSVLEYINTTYSEEFSKCNTPDKYIDFVRKYIPEFNCVNLGEMNEIKEIKIQLPE